jgi:hypothetical protein
MRPPGAVGSARQGCRNPAEQPEAPVIIGPVAAIGCGVRVSGPVIEWRVIDEVCVTAGSGQPRARYPDPLGRKRRRQPNDIGDLGKCIEEPGKPRQYQSGVDIKGGQRRRQRGSDITEPPRFDPRIKLGSDMQDPHRRAICHR